MGRIIDLFGGPGGWDEALAELGRSADVLGIEWDEAACSTRTAAGHATRRADVSTVDHREYADLEGLIASPPCQGFSSAGNGAARDLIPELLASIHARRWTDRADEDPRVWLIVDLGRWLEQLSPEWYALEQVPAVLPVWRAYADLLRDRGYSTWTGILNAADYGVPQTRERAIMMAHRSQLVHPPAATHAEDPTPSLFGTLERWVNVIDVLPHLPGRMGFPRLDDRGDSPDGYRERDWRPTCEPAFALAEKARSWIIDRPATTVMGDPRLFQPGGHHTPGAQSENAIRLEARDALVLQSFRPDYPVQGTKTKQFEQIGNAIPPRLARHVLEALIVKT